MKGFRSNLEGLVPGREPQVKMFKFSRKERLNGYDHLSICKEWPWRKGTLSLQMAGKTLGL